jgi:hypothetical protein
MTRHDGAELVHLQAADGDDDGLKGLTRDLGDVFRMGGEIALDARQYLGDAGTGRIEG